MEREGVSAPGTLLRRLTLPIAAIVAVLVAAAWYTTWATADLLMALLGTPSSSTGALGLTLAFLLLVVMMVAMMLPSALPMVLTYDGLTRLGGEEPVGRPDHVGTMVFASAYFAVWGLVGVAFLLALSLLGVMDSMGGVFVWGPALILLAAGAYQFTRAKEACLSHCQSPVGFAMAHWRSGRRGAWRMGLRHAAYCVGCCWLFMLVLFVSGAMSLVWMAVISVAIFVEKIGWRPVLVSRTIGALLVVAGALLVVQAAVLA